MLSLNSPAFTALVYLVMLLLRSPVAVKCFHLTVPYWKMAVALVFYYVINEFPGCVVLAAFVAALALLVYTFRFTRVIALCMQGVSPFDDVRYATIDAQGSRMCSPDVSGASLVARDVAASPPLHVASAPAMLSSEACSSPRQLEGASEIVSSPFSSPSVNGPGPLDRADHEYRPIVVGSVLVTNPNLISPESDTVLAGLSFDELCQLEADEKAYYLSRNMEIASDCDSPSDVAALSAAPVVDGVASGSAVVNDICAHMFSGAGFGGIATATVSAGVCFSSVAASSDLVSFYADNSVIGIKRSRENMVDDSGAGETSRKRSKTRFTTAVCGFCYTSVLRAVARADALCFGSCPVLLGCKRPRSGGDAGQEGKRLKAAFAGDNCLAFGSFGESVRDAYNTASSSSVAAASIVAVPAAAFGALPAVAISSVLPAVASSANLSAAAFSAVPAAVTAVTTHHSTAASPTLVAPVSAATAATVRRYAVPRASSRRRVALTPTAVSTHAATTATTPANAPATTNTTGKQKGENIEGRFQLQNCPLNPQQKLDPDIGQSENDTHDESEGFDLSAEELDRILNELDEEIA